MDWRMKILVVDDMISMRHVMLHMLRDLGYCDFDEATDGVQALAMLHKSHYQLVITDLHMPNLDGQQLLHRIRTDEHLSGLPVLMVTCEADKEKIKSILSSNVTGFIIKPFTTNTLKKQLERVKSLCSLSV